MSAEKTKKKITPIDIWATDQVGEDEMNDDHPMLWRRMIDLMEERDLTHKRVLDFGCNQGGFLRTLHGVRPFERALGVDIALNSIAKATSRVGLVPARYAVMTDLGGLKEEFDIAFSHEVIYLLEDIDYHAAQIFDCLRPGGVYYAAIGCYADHPNWALWQKTITAISSIPIYSRNLSDYVSAFRGVGFTASARRFHLEEFIPVTQSTTLFPSVQSQLEYYDSIKVLFRLVKPR